MHSVLSLQREHVRIDSPGIVASYAICLSEKSLDILVRYAT